MKIYGYTVINTDRWPSGKETQTRLFPSEESRNKAMYNEYTDTFRWLSENDQMEQTDDGMYADANGTPELTQKEFFQEIATSIENHTVIGSIQLSDYHIQFEPFTQYI